MDNNPFDAVVAQQPEASDNPFDSVVGNTPAPAAPAANPFDQVVADGAKNRERQQFLETLRNSKDIVPERQAQAIETAQLRGVPVGVAYKYLEDLQPKPQAPDFDSLTHKAPATARLLADPVKGPVAFPDAQPLGDIEQTLKAFSISRGLDKPKMGPPLPLYEQIMGAGTLASTPEEQAAWQRMAVRDAAEALNSAKQNRLGGSVVGFGPRLMPVPASGFNQGIDAAEQRLADAKANLPTQTSTSAQANAALRSVASGVTTAGQGLSALADVLDYYLPLGKPILDAQGRSEATMYFASFEDYWSKVFPEDKARSGEFGVRVSGALASAAPFVAGGAAVKALGVSPGWFAALYGAFQQAGQGEQDAVEHGAGPGVKNATVLLNALLGATEAVPIEALFATAAAGKKGLAQFLIDTVSNAGIEATQNLVQQLPADIWARVLYDPKRDVVGNAAEATLMGGIVGGVFGASASLLGSSSEEHHAGLLALGDAASKAKILDHAPAIVDEHVQQLVESGNAPAQVTAPAEAVDTLFQEVAGENLDQLFPKTAQSLREAKATGAEVTIPTEELVRLGKLKGYSTFAADVRVGEDMTLNEATKLREDVASYLKEQGAAETPAPQAESPIYTDIRDQLVKAGQSLNVATAQARLMDAFFQSQSERTGVAATDLARRYGVEISNSALGEAAGKTTLAQAGGPTLTSIAEAAKASGVSLAVSESKGVITLSKIVADTQGQGAGTKTMDALVRYADATGQRIALSPSSDFGGSKPRLQQFYKRFGFVENKGRSKDLSVSETMIREPAKTTFTQGGKDVRGSITFGPLRDKFHITLTEKANLSTFLHEGGHFFLEVLQDLVARGEASAQQVADLKTLKRWMGIEDGQQIDRAGHEKFARSFEQFLMEGKAPSLALHSIFQKFKAWMIFVYKRLANVQGGLSDDIRTVMDRLVASDAAIAEARTLVGWRGQPMSQEETGLTDAEYKDYVAQWTKANDAQAADADARIMLEAARELKKTWAEEKAKVTREVEAEVHSTRGWTAWKLLENGQGLEDFGRSTLKLDPETVPKEWRGDTRGMTAPADQGGMPFDAVAEMLGFETGEEMMRLIGGARLAEKAIGARVRQIMTERHGEMDAAALSQEAMKAVHNTPTMDILLTEFRALAAKANLKIGKDTHRLVKAAAEERVAQTQVRKLEPSKWRRAEVKAAEEAGKLAAKGKDMEAALAKRRQLMAAAMAKASLEAQDRASAIKDYLDTFTTNRRRAALGKAGDTYLDQVDQILEAVQLKEVSLKAIKARQGLDEFVKEQEAAGEPVFISSATRDLLGRKNYTEMSLEELEGIHDAVKNLWTVAKEINTVRREGEKIALENALAEIEKETESLLPVKGQRAHLPNMKTKVDKARELLAKYHAGNLKMEFVLDWMGKTAHSLVYQPIADAYRKSWELHRDLTAPFMDKLRTMPKEQKRRWNTKREFLSYPGGPLKGANIWTIALNLGNEGNKAKMLAGYGWTEQQVMAELATFMTKEDWDLAQETWDTIDKMWPRMAEVVKRATGLTPPKVEATPIVTPFGTYRGGYFPVVYDTVLDSRMDDKLDSSISPEEMFSKRFTAFVINNGFTKGRTGNVGKLLFSPDIIAQHLGEVIHYATHYDAVKQADKIIRAPAFKALVKGHLGDAVYAEMKQWLKDVATNTTRSDRQQQSGDRALRWARSSAQLTSLGLNIKSALKQPLGIVATLDAIKPQHLAKGIYEAWLSPSAVANWKFAFEHSKELGPLVNGYDRDLANISRSYADSLGNRAGQAVYTAAFMPISVMQSVANVAAWRGAFSQAKKEGMTDQDAFNFADKTVRETQGSGALKDLSGMQRGGEANKFFTMFYSYFGVLYNRMADIQVREKGIKKLHRKVGRYAVLLLMGEIFNSMFDDAWDKMFPPDKKRKEDNTPFLVRLALNTVDSAINTLPVVRDVVTLAETALGGGQARTPPGFNGIVKAGQGLGAIARLLEGKGMTRAKGRNIAALAGILTNQPVYGVYRALDDLFGQEVFPE